MRVSLADLQGSFTDFIATKAVAAPPSQLPPWGGAGRPDVGGAAAMMMMPMAAPPPPQNNLRTEVRIATAEPAVEVQVEEPEVPPPAETLKRHAVESDLSDRVQVSAAVVGPA